MMSASQVLRENPRRIEFEDRDYYGLAEVTELREPSEINRVSHRKDAETLRDIRLALLEEGTEHDFVNVRYVAELTGKHPTHIKYCLMRLAENGMIKKFWRYYKDKGGQKYRYYYHFGAWE